MLTYANQVYQYDSQLLFKGFNIKSHKFNLRDDQIAKW